MRASQIELFIECDQVSEIGALATSNRFHYDSLIIRGLFSAGL